MGGIRSTKKGQAQEPLMKGAEAPEEILTPVEGFTAVSVGDSVVGADRGTDVPARSASKSRKEDARSRRELVEKRFHPSAVRFLKDGFRIDVLNLSFPLSAVYDIAEGRVTEPLEMSVVPLTYDREKKAGVSMPPIKVVASMKFVFPFKAEKDPSGKFGYELCEITNEHPVFITSCPVFPYVKEASGASSGEDGPQEAREVQEEVSRREPPRFSPAQVMALEGIGIREGRLYSSSKDRESFNAVPVSVKRDMLDGKPFEVAGTVKTAYGWINVSGTGLLETRPDGSCSARFEPYYPVRQTKDDLLDILSVRRSGALEFDVFERDMRGSVRRDDGGMPVLNAAGRSLVKYGCSMGPVKAFIHGRKHDEASGRYVDTVTTGYYYVSVVNGGLLSTAMRRVSDDAGALHNPDNYEVKECRVLPDGTIPVDKKETLSFATPEDLENYRKGIGGKVVGHRWHDYKEGKDIVYDAWAVPDNRNNGFPKIFSPSASAKIIAEFAERRKSVRMKRPPVRRRNFSMGL